MSTHEAAVRVLVAALAGLLNGLPFWRRTGGIRTHVLVACGAAIFCITAVPLAGVDTRELMRVLQGVASGIGFVGAATVLKRGGAIVGVNVAASIWVCAALACEAGMGNVRLALSLAVIVAVLSAGLRWLDHRLETRPGS